MTIVINVKLGAENASPATWVWDEMEKRAPVPCRECAKLGGNLEKQGGARMEIETLCEHEFPPTEDFCTHLGHETLGAHIRHYVCRLCGALKSVTAEEGGILKERIKSANEAMQVIYFRNLIKRPHRCVSGWRGQIVFDEPSNIKDTYH